MRVHIAMLLAALAALSSPGMAQGQLGIAEVRALVSGTTVDILNLSSGQPFRAYFAASGELVIQRPDAVEVAGRWNVREDGSHCVHFDRESCGKLSKNADGSYTRVVDDALAYRWLRVTPGKDF